MSGYLKFHHSYALLTAPVVPSEGVIPSPLGEGEGAPTDSAEMNQNESEWVSILTPFTPDPPCLRANERRDLASTPILRYYPPWRSVPLRQVRNNNESRLP